MDYEKYMKDGLKKFDTVLRENNIFGEQRASYMQTEVMLLKSRFLFLHDPSLGLLTSKIRPLVRIRQGLVVWYGFKAGDFLSRTDVLNIEYLSNPKKHGFVPHKIDNLQNVGEQTVYFPSSDATEFSPSSLVVLQQLICSKTDIKDLLFEVQLQAEEPASAYDEVLQCHVATVILYREIVPLRDEKSRQEIEVEKPGDKESDIKVKEVNKVKEPHRPRHFVPMRQH